MKILQVQFKNRNGHTLRGIVTLPDTEGKVPFVVHLHGFAGSCSGYKSMYTHLSRALAAQGIGSARFDFYGNGESDGEFEDMSFDGLHTDAQDIFAWAAEQPYVDSEKLFLSGQSMGGYIAASCAPVIQPHGLILLCPGAGMWFGCAQRADGIMQTGERNEGIVYSTYSFFRKLASAISGSLSSFVLGAIGYNVTAGAVQTAGVVNAIWKSYTGVYFLGYGIAVAILFFVYPLTKQKTAEMLAELKSRRAAKESK